MEIWLIQIGETLPLIPDARKLRTALLADKLNALGHRVTWWASAFDHFQKDWVFSKDTKIALSDGVDIIALKGAGYKRNVSISRWIDHRMIARKFRHRAGHCAVPDLIVASMPSYDLAFEAVQFAKKHKVPVVIDIRDQWPDIFLDKVPVLLKKLGRLALSGEFRLLNRALRDCDAIISMMNVLLEWGLDCAKRTKSWKDQVFYLGYKRSNGTVKRSKKIERLKEQIEKSFVVTFIGTFGSYHDPSIIVEAARRLATSNISFVLAGSGEKFDHIKEKSRNLKNIHLPGWLNQNEIDALLQYSDAGVCPSTQCANFFPNKSFLYLSKGIPVISAFEGDLKQLIEKKKIGFYYTPNDVEALVKCFTSLMEDEQQYKEISKNAMTVFEKMFDSEMIYEKYALHLLNIATTKK